MQPRLLPYFPASGLLPRLKHIDEATGQIQCTLAGSFPRRTSNNSPLAFFMKQATADDGLK